MLLTFFNSMLLADTWEPAKTYLTIVAMGGPFVLISNCYSNILRAEGQPGRATAGQVLGNLLNVVLDPVMILVLNWGIAGAAAQALITNLSRQGIIYIPALFLLQALLQAKGLAWAQPVADLLSTVLVLTLYLWTFRKMMTAADLQKEKG